MSKRDRITATRFGLLCGIVCTLGGCGVWQLIDIIMIVTGKYTDAQGRPLQT